jgi:hypothetical protein
VRLAQFYGNALYCQEVNCGLDILRLVRLAGVACYKRRPLSHRTGARVFLRGVQVAANHGQE